MTKKGLEDKVEMLEARVAILESITEGYWRPWENWQKPEEEKSQQKKKTKR